MTNESRRLQVQLSVTIPVGDFVLMARGFLELLQRNYKYGGIDPHGDWSTPDAEILTALAREIYEYYKPKGTG